MLLKLVTVIASILFLTATQEIIDFSLTDHVQKTFNSDRKNIDLSIHPPTQRADYLVYPGACSLQSFLSENSPMETEELLLLQEQKQLAILKQGMRELFSLSQRIKKSKNTIADLTPKVAQHKDEDFDLKAFQLEELQLLENQLRKINDTISSRVQGLRILILQELNRTKENTLDQVRLQFQLAIYQSRLKYLIVFQQSKAQFNQKPNFQAYLSDCFGDIEESIWRQKKELSSLKDLLDGFSRRQQLKIKISNLQSQLQGTNLMIKEKESCDEKKGELHNRENKKAFDKIYNELKQLKSHEGSNTSYCQGVARLLQKQLKKILKVYNYSYACSQGLSDLQNSRIVILQELQRYKRQSNEEEYDSQSNRLKHYFEQQHLLREELIITMQGLKLSQHQIDKERIEQQISIVRQQIKQIQYRLAHPPESEVPPIDYSAIRQVVAQIEQDQQQYCQLKEQYIAKYRGYDVMIRSFEHRTFLLRQEQAGFLLEIDNLRSLSQKFQDLRRRLLKQVQ